MPHPEPQKLGRFLRGELSQDECRLIVRHLLADCPECAAVIRRSWALSDDPSLAALPLGRLERLDCSPNMLQQASFTAAGEYRWGRSKPVLSIDVFSEAGNESP